MPFCKNCGNQLEDGAMFCTKCGQSVNDTTANNQPNYQNTQQNAYQQPAGAPVYQNYQQPMAANTPKKNKGTKLLISSAIMSVLTVLSLFGYKLAQENTVAKNVYEYAQSIGASTADYDFRNMLPIIFLVLSAILLITAIILLICGITSKNKRN